MIENILNFLKMLVENDPQLTAVYLIIAKIIGAVTFLPGTPLTLLAGGLLGTFWGSVVSLMGNTLGATLAFLVARYLFRDYVQQKLLPKYPKIKEYEEKLFKNGFKTILFLRLVPLFPFNALNYLLGVTQVSFRDYFLGTAIGIIPGTIAFVYFGESLKMLSVFNIVLAAGAIAALILIPRFWKI